MDSAARPIEGKRVLVTGGTGSLGKPLVKRILGGSMGEPETVTVFSRDEGKHHEMKSHYLNAQESTDDVLFRNFENLLRFRVGDVRDYSAVLAAVRRADIVFHAAALKQVPSCEYFPSEAVATNIGGAVNVARAILSSSNSVEMVVGISTDKCVSPVNVMGMTKGIQERVFLSANVEQDDTSFVCVRYGNVLSSRGSVVPYFREQAKNGRDLTLTTREMTRFLLTLEEAVDTIFDAILNAKRGEILIPQIPAARIEDVAKIMAERAEVGIREVGIRPGEKVHEVLVSGEESHRTTERQGTIRPRYYAIGSILPEVAEKGNGEKRLETSYSSNSDLMSAEQVEVLLESNGFLAGNYAREASR